MMLRRRKEDDMGPVGTEPLSRHALAYVLAGGRGSRLLELTDRRAKPAVYFGGKSRIIDFALSNAVNSGIRRIAVATQYKAHSLIRHLQMGWNFFRPERNESFDILPASQRVSESMWYVGTADAIYQNIDIIESHNARFIVVLAGDHIYKMDYEVMLRQHVESGADVTVGCLEMPRAESSGFGIMHIDENGWIQEFLEKPKDPPPMPGKPDVSLASMGIYVFNAEFLFQELERDAADSGSSHDFGRDIIPNLLERARVYAHRFQRSCVYSAPGAEPYWRDAGTIDAYWEANIDLTRFKPALDLYDTNWPIFTYQEQLPPAKFVHDTDERRGLAVNSIVSGGCIVSGATVRQSLLFSKVRVNSYAYLRQSVILPEVNIGRHARLYKAVVDRGCDIPPGLVVGDDEAEDARRFYRSEGGVTLVTKEMLARLTPEDKAALASAAAAAPP
jgi:glucose-1-phosphate adenylyltransferase